MNPAIKYLFLLTLFYCSSSSFAQQDPTTTLKTELKNAKHDTTTLRLLVALSEESEANSMLKYAEPASELADKLLNASPSPDGKYRTWLLNKKSLAINNIGFVYYTSGDLLRALDYWQKSLKISEETGDKEAIGTLYNNIASVFDVQGAIPKALDYYSKSLKLQEELGNNQGIATALINMGTVYEKQNDDEKAFEYYNKCVALYQLAGDKYGYASALNNIGNVYAARKDSGNAFKYYRRSIAAMEEVGNKQGIAVTLNNIGEYYHRLNGDLSAVLKYYNKALVLYKGINDQSGLSSIYNNIGAAYSMHKKYGLARSYYDSSMVIARKIGEADKIKNSEKSLALIDSINGNFTGAFAHYKQFIRYRDLIANEESRKASYRTQVNYEFEKKQDEIKATYEKEQAITAEKNRRQKLIIWAGTAGSVLVLLFAVFVVRSLRLTRKQKHIIEEKQKDILDSIRYAKRIQTSLMPTEKYIDKALKRTKE